MPNTRIITLAALALLAGAAAAHQDQGGASEPPARRADDPTLLRGPRVNNAERPDRGQHARERARDRDGQAMDDAEAPRPVAMPFQAYLAALRSLQRGEDQSLRLTPEQAEQMRAIAAEHREAMQAFMEEHRAEIDELRAVIGENRVRRADQANAPRSDQDAKAANAEDTRPIRARNTERRRVSPQDANTEPTDTMQPADQPASAPGRHSPEDRAAAREKLRELMASGVQEQRSRNRLLAVLTDAQRERVEAAVKAQAERVHDARAGDRARPGAARRPDAPARDAAGANPRRAPADQNRAERTRRGRDDG
jgi:hypothetical protein